MAAGKERENDVRTFGPGRGDFRLVEYSQPEATARLG